MKLCIRGHDLQKTDPDNLAQNIKNSALNGVQLALKKSFPNLEADTLHSQTFIAGTRKAFDAAGLEIAMLGAYFNPVHSNPQKVRDGLGEFERCLKSAPALGCALVGSETGSRNDDSWTYNPENRSAATFARLVAVFGELAEKSKNYGSFLALEGAHGHCCHSPEVLKKLADEIGADRVYFTVDMFNWLSSENVPDATALFESSLSVLAERIKIFHIKDCVVAAGKLVRVPFGDGIIEWGRYLPAIKRLYPDAYLVFEGEPPASLDRSIARVRALTD